MGLTRELCSGFRYNVIDGTVLCKTDLNSSEPLSCFDVFNGGKSLVFMSQPTLFHPDQSTHIGKWLTYHTGLHINLSQKLTHFTFGVFWDPRGDLWPGKWYQEYLRAIPFELLRKGRRGKFCRPLPTYFNIVVCLPTFFVEFTLTFFRGPKRPQKAVGRLKGCASVEVLSLMSTWVPLLSCILYE